MRGTDIFRWYTPVPTSSDQLVTFIIWFSLYAFILHIGIPGPRALKGCMFVGSSSAIDLRMMQRRYW
jgi:hypothetical protein